MTAICKKPEGFVRGAKLRGNPPVDKPNDERKEHPKADKPTAYPDKHPPPPVTGSVNVTLPEDGVSNKGRFKR